MGPGIITEQGDLGLGFDPLNENDQQTYENSQQKDIYHSTESSVEDEK